MGTSFVFLNAEKPDCLLKECNLGNLFTDAFVFHNANLTASETQWTEASIAIQNSGSITASMFVSAQGKSQPDLVPRVLSLLLARKYFLERGPLERG